ncbi:hypothetical protein WJX72_008069 [[Myrmecia] bisecta]|uniref:Uncharacterized protein n=1 Tax=[Myrmecia] bisecta TaxID=41462 RepID=A0AAW1P3T2_9CHLO
MGTTELQAVICRLHIAYQAAVAKHIESAESSSLAELLDILCRISPEIAEDAMVGEVLHNLAEVAYPDVTSARN